MKSICCLVLTALLVLAVDVGSDDALFAQGSANEELLEKVNIYFGVELFGPDGNRIDVAENRLRTRVENMGFMIRGTSPYKMHGRADIVDSQKVEGGMAGSQHVLIMELQVVLEDTRDNQIFGSATFGSKGMGDTEAKAVKKAVKNLKFGKEELNTLRDRALERVALLLDEDCTRLYEEAKKLYDQRDFRAALVPLSNIVEGATVYEESEKLKDEINQALWKKEENRIKLAQAKCQEAEEKKLEAKYKAEEAQRRQQVMQDSLAIVRTKAKIMEDSLAIAKEKRLETAARYEFELEKLKNEIQTREKDIQLAAEEKEIAYIELAKTLHTQQYEIALLDSAWANVGPDEDNEDESEDDEPWERTPDYGVDDVAGKWELVKSNSVSGNKPMESGTLEFDSKGRITIWVFGETNEIVMGRGSFSIDGNNLVFNFDEQNIADYLDKSYEVEIPGTSRLYLVDSDGDQLAFCKMST